MSDPWADLYIDPSEEPPVSENPFATIPHMVLLKALSPFLTPLDRTALNGALEWQERVHKPLPTDYALKHHLRILLRKNKRMVNELNRLLQIDDNPKATQRAYELYGKLCEFYQDPMTVPLFQYTEQAINDVLFNLGQLVMDDDPFYEYPGMTASMAMNLMHESNKTTMHVMKYTFERHVIVTDHVNVFAS
jgi:hypothetical protein